MEPPRVGCLSTSAGPSRTFFQTIYQPGSSELTIERAGVFWEAAQVAATLCLRGNGRRVAILDSGFDLSVEPLASVASPASITTPETVKRHGHHGTVVALLVHEVAPDAELILLDVDPLTERSIATGLERAGKAGADVVNVSLELESDCPVSLKPGFNPLAVLSKDIEPEAFLLSLDGWIRHPDIYSGGCRRNCEVCAAIDALPEKTLVIAAAGNRYCPACPSCNHRCLGVGFEHQFVTPHGDKAMLVSEFPSGFEQAGMSEVVLPQPAGFLGTSFASPLLTALAAVVRDPQDLAAMARFPMKMAPVTWILHPVQTSGKATQKQLECIHRGFLRLVDELPPGHRHWEENVVVPCVLCSMFVEGWYRDFISFLTSTGNMEWALRLGDVGETALPRSAEVVGNFGVGLRAMGEATEDPAKRRYWLELAARRFRRAAALRPQTPMYLQEAVAIERVLH